MVVVVSKTAEGARSYRISPGADLLDDELARKKADKLDVITEKTITALVKRLNKKNLPVTNSSKNNLKIYWELGKTLSSIADNNELLNPIERPVFWLNAKMYIPESLLKVDRSANRVHLEFCYRLGKLPFDKVKKLNWGEWLTLFERTSIKSEIRFDKWFEGILNKSTQKIDRYVIRTFVKILNTLIGNIDTQLMNNRELFNCYDAAWEIWELANKRLGNLNDLSIMKNILLSIKGNYSKLSEVMDSELSPENYAELIINGC